MKKINKYQEALDELIKIIALLKNTFSIHKFEELINKLKALQELVDKELYIELGMELHKQISKPCYSSEDEEMIYLDLRKYYENWLAKYED